MKSRIDVEPAFWAWGERGIAEAARIGGPNRQRKRTCATSGRWSDVVT